MVIWWKHGAKLVELLLPNKSRVNFCQGRPQTVFNLYPRIKNQRENVKGGVRTWKFTEDQPTEK